VTENLGSLDMDNEMQFVTIEKRDGITTLTLNRGKVNALNQVVVDEVNYYRLEVDSFVCRMKFD